MAGLVGLGNALGELLDRPEEGRILDALGELGLMLLGILIVTLPFLIPLSSR